ncbi:MAG: type I-D CRISPR-associated helicase Cas3' [Methanothrix sp.]|jgi:CRISPR-associated endonuclease/helicase Cas3|uniref:type I-D CRISPR-associated helicase Cas3' n=1 Tax=Methanothrix sp. TaxID=90426 RepID=UPI0025CF6AF4|nr:type I-D CRISPR-associated helicase Cas3' [Methanothrix sp.]MBK7385534.1 type I-D CRISPR-associated helicase Cas3' [Methanothrix sp.]
MNLSETDLMDNSEKIVVNLDGIRLAQMHWDYLRDFESLKDFKAFEHQIDSEKFIKSNESFFLFNHSPTGSGKTISWLKPALDEKMKVIAVYPTNALVIDQKKQVDRSLERFGYNSQDYHVQAITGELLVEEKKLYPDEIGLRKGQLLNRIIRKGRGRGLILLTNPDILTLALKDAYYEHNIREAIRSVDMIVVDEFHLASVKQSDMLLFMMHEMSTDKRSRLKKFVFLSATPNQQIVERAKKAKLNVVIFDDKSTPLSCSEGRPVLPQLKLLVRSGAIYKTYELIKKDLGYFVDLCRRQLPNGNKAKTVFILDGIYEVDEIFSVLKDALHDQGFIVERVDGLHPATEEKLKNFDVLVSNSSVEVGIDFNVDRLVFSGYSKSKLLQRIGRLRNKPENEICEAVCFVPNVLYDHLKGLSARAGSLRLTRKEFVDQLDKLMESGLDLSSYSRTYSPMEAYLYLKSRIKGSTWQDSLGEEHREKGMPESIQGEEWIRTLKLLESHFLDRDIDGQMFDWLDEESRRLQEGLLTYRGSRFQALMFDRDEKQLNLYDLMYLLRRGKVEFMPSQRFAQRLREAYGENYDADMKPRYESMKRFAAGFCWYYGTLGEETRKVVFKGEGAHYKKIMLNAADHARKPRMVDGFKVETEPNIPSLSCLNDTLTEYKIFARLIDQSGSYLKAKFNLGDFFYLYPYSGMRSVAFGHDALYIDCLIRDEYERRR